MGSRDADRFWRKVRKGRGCWEWISCKGEKGYGSFGVGHKTKRAHRFSWEMSKGKIPDGMCVLHRCDNPRCVRPDHLFLGTPKDNTMDMIRKGRERRKFTDRQIERMCRLLSSGRTSREVALAFGASKSWVATLRSGKNKKSTAKINEWQRKNRRSVSRDQVVRIKDLLVNSEKTHYEIARACNCTCSIVAGISSGDTHAGVMVPGWDGRTRDRPRANGIKLAGGACSIAELARRSGISYYAMYFRLRRKAARMQA